MHIVKVGESDTLPFCYVFFGPVKLREELLFCHQSFVFFLGSQLLQVPKGLTEQSLVLGYNTHCSVYLCIQFYSSHSCSKIILSVVVIYRPRACSAGGRHPVWLRCHRLWCRRSTMCLHVPCASPGLAICRLWACGVGGSSQ